jgi:hypothetical protein
MAHEKGALLRHADRTRQERPSERGRKTRTEISPVGSGREDNNAGVSQIRSERQRPLGWLEKWAFDDRQVSQPRPQR